MLEYLETFHAEDIEHIVDAPSKQDIVFRALPIDLNALKIRNFELFQNINYRINVWKEKDKWTKALTEAQEKHIKSQTLEFGSLKKDFPVTFVNLLNSSKIFKPHKQLWNLVQVTGNVYRTKERGLMEVTREYKCRKCKKSKIIKANRLTQFNFDIPDRCVFSRECKGAMYKAEEDKKDEINFNHVIDFQELKIQLSDKGNSISQWLKVEVEQEFVESCFIGDRVTLVGTLETRSEKKINVHELVMRAVSVIVQENQQKINIDPTELKNNVEFEWQMDLKNNNELEIRDEMVNSVAPEVKGLAILKLGVLLTLCSGGKTNDCGGFTQTPQKSSTTREICHLLMIGDPGLGKSQILKAASEISTNAVRTVGYAATTAGLTASCFVEGGESHIEAGALVKANNGICCLDELNYMSKEHRSSIHEVMEHQKISMAKGEHFCDFYA
jgi:DNA replicative helicase MCM subunit Mcm2 (Cdc46/Mcm family)